MQRLPCVLFSLFVSLVLLASMLAVCDAHFSATEHPDCCAYCAVASSSRREDGGSAPVPVGPHHCPDHLCAHLHAPFVVESSLTLPLLVSSRVFLASPPFSAHPWADDLLRPPQV